MRETRHLDRSAPAPTPGRDRHEGTALRRVRSDELLAAGQALHIEHDGNLYILRRTSNGKLILTK